METLRVIKSEDDHDMRLIIWTKFGHRYLVNRNSHEKGNLSLMKLTIEYMTQNMPFFLIAEVARYFWSERMYEK